MFETCIFDLYGTLVDIHTDENTPFLWGKLAAFYGFYGARYEPQELRAAYERLTKELQSGKEGIRHDAHEACPEIEIEEVFACLFAEKGCAADETLAVHAGQFFRILSLDYFRLYDGTLQMLDALRKAGKRVYLLSNAQRIFTEYEMNALGLTKYFDGIFISSEHGVKKPDVRFFEKLLKRYNIPRETAVMIGNDGVCDVEGAKRAGLATVYIHSNISPNETGVQADYVLDHMDMDRVRRILLGEER